MRLHVFFPYCGFGVVGEILADGVWVFGDTDGGDEDELVDAVFVFHGVADGEVSAEGVAHECESLYPADLSPFLESVDEPVFGFCDFRVGFFGLDAECWTGGTAVAKEVERPDFPAGPPGEHVVVSVEEGEPRAVPVEHDEVVPGAALGSACDGEFVDYAVLSREGDHVGGAFSRAMAVGLGRGGGGFSVPVLGGERGCGLPVEGEEAENGGFCDSRGYGGPLWGR